MKKHPAPEWPTIVVNCPDNTMRLLLLYWVYMWTPRDGVWVHEEDVKKHKKLIKSANRLLEYFTE